MRAQMMNKSCQFQQLLRDPPCKSWRKWLGKGKSGSADLDCCLALDEWMEMDELKTSLCFQPCGAAHPPANKTPSV